jgi:hypothetical protein
MFYKSTIETFTSKGDISLIGITDAMFCDAGSFNSDLRRWNVVNLLNMYGAFLGAESFNSDLNRWESFNKNLSYDFFNYLNYMF